jgi:hypothetical protein
MTSLDVFLESTSVFICQMVQSFIPIQEKNGVPPNEQAALIYIAATGGAGMVMCLMSFFFEYKFEGIVGHHYPKSLSVSFDSRA